jgi:hypothetical protein
MVRTVIDEPIALTEAVALKILTPAEARLTSSVTKIGEGGFGSIYKLCQKRPITDQGLEGPHSETPVRSRNVPHLF